MKAAKDGDEVLKVPEVARRLRVSLGFAYQLVRNGKLPVLDLGGAIRIPRAPFERLLSERAEKVE